MKKSQKQRVCIIGGGITGYAFAWFLSQKSPHSKITVIEKEVKGGGLAKSIKSQFGFEIDQFYHFLYHHDSKNTLDFFHELGLAPQVIWNSIESAVFVNNELFSVGKLSALLKIRHLNMRDKLQFILAIIRILLTDFKKLDQISCEAYLIRTFGQKNYQLIWAPLLIAKFSAYYRTVPASWIARRIQVTFLSRGLSGKTKYGYITGTYGPLFRRLLYKLKARRVSFSHDQVTSIEQVGNQVEVVAEKTGKQHFDKVIVATPISVTRNLIQNTNVKKQLSRYKELNAVVTLFFLKQKFSDYFWINVNDLQIPFTGIIELTNLTGTTMFNGMSVVYLSEYISDKSNFDREDYQKNLITYLQKVNSEFSQDWVIGRYDFFAPGAAPIPFLGYYSQMPPFQTKQKRIHSLNSSMIFPQDRGVGNSIQLARKNVEAFING